MDYTEEKILGTHLPPIEEKVFLPEKIRVKQETLSKKGVHGKQKLIENHGKNP